MRGVTSLPPVATIEPVTDFLHGTQIVDPYRWLEDQNSLRTRDWIGQQTRYARQYLDNISGRERIRQRITDFLAVESYDSLQEAGGRYFFRKRLPHQEQPCIYMRQGPDGEDQLLVDPAAHEGDSHTAVRLLQSSVDGKLLLYEIKHGGERSGKFAIFDAENRLTLPDVLPRGYLRGFAFAQGGKSFYYVHEALDAKRRFYRAAYRHVLGTPFTEDREVFFAGEREEIRLGLISDITRLGFLVYTLLDKFRTDFYLQEVDSNLPPQIVLSGIGDVFGPLLIPGRILAITDRNAPNLKIVELRMVPGGDVEWVDLVRECDRRIDQWFVVGDRIAVSYSGPTTTISLFDLSGCPSGEIKATDETIRVTGGSERTNEFFVETESFTQPIAIARCSADGRSRSLWVKRNIPFDSKDYRHEQVWYESKDGTKVPMFLMGRHDVIAGGSHPAIMTSYGGYGVSMTPQFSAFVAFMVERGCLFALPNIRGGAEFGAEWHNAAKRRGRQRAFDDFLCAAEWLIHTGRTSPCKLAIFGGSNSGLLVGAAMTQRPDLFGAVVCMVPVLDMLRYHLFDGASLWREEFGTADDPDDFAALARYSPYHNVRDNTLYPATLIISGDADRNCNSLHARKMTARLQAANVSEGPVLLDYNEFRGHSPVLPLSQRIEALTDRMAFLCDQLQISV